MNILKLYLFIFSLFKRNKNNYDKLFLYIFFFILLIITNL